MNRCEPPWFLIAKQAVRGASLQTLSVRFNVSVEDIRRHLDKAIVSSANGQMYVRTSAEINQASARARNDLVSILLEAIEELSVSTQPRLSQLKEFNELLGAAARLFQWPMLTATRFIAHQREPVQGYGVNPEAQPPSSSVPTAAVNLALIATPPERLAELAKEKILDEVGPKPQEPAQH